MATALLGGSVLGWLIAGAALYYALSASGNVSITQPKFDQFSDPGVGGGPWQASTTSQTPISLVFGTCRAPLPIVHYRLDGDQFRNMWIVASVGEDWGSLSADYNTELKQLWVNDYEIKNLAEYTDNEELKDRNHSWYKFYPNGLGASIEWDSTGNHAFVKEAIAGTPAETYTMICTHDSDQGAGPVHIEVRIIHQWEEGGATQKWVVKVKYSEEVPGNQVITVATGEQFFDATQTVSAGKDTETYHVAGTRETIHGFDMPYRGKFTISLENISGGGRMYLDSVEITDPGQATESVNSYGTSLVLIRIIDNTGELARPQLTGLIKGGPSNPVEALEWVLTNKEMGMALPPEHLDRGSFFELKDQMDAMGYSFNRAYCAISTFENVLNEICLAGRLLLADWNGLITVFVDEEEATENLPIVDLDNEAVAGSVGYSQKSLREIPNRFDIQYVDANHEYGLQDVITENVELQQKAGVVNEINIPMVGVTSMGKAWNLGWYQIQYAMSNIYMQFDALPKVWTLRPGRVFKSISENDPLINNKEWIVLSVDESKPGQYRVRAGEYRREAYNPPALNEWTTDVWIPGETPAEGSVGSITPAKMSITSYITDNTSQGYIDVYFNIVDIPPKTKKIKVFRSYNPWLEESGDLSSYESVGEIITSHGTYYDSTANYMTVEIQRYTPIRYRFVAVDMFGWEAESLAGSPMVTVYPFNNTEGLPGYGIGEYGIIPYGG